MLKSVIELIKRVLVREEVKVVANLSDECDFDRFYVNRANTLLEIANESVIEEDKALRNLLKLKKWNKQGLEKVSPLMLDQTLELNKAYPNRVWLEELVSNSLESALEIEIENIEDEFLKKVAKDLVKNYSKSWNKVFLLSDLLKGIKEERLEREVKEIQKVEKELELTKEKLVDRSIDLKNAPVDKIKGKQLVIKRLILKIKVLKELLENGISLVEKKEELEKEIKVLNVKIENCKSSELDKIWDLRKDLKNRLMIITRLLKK